MVVHGATASRPPYGGRQPPQSCCHALHGSMTAPPRISAGEPLGNGTGAVPYKSYRRDTPPGVSGPHHQKKDYPPDNCCHCEAEGRGNLLERFTNLKASPGDSHVASLLGMTGKTEPGPSSGGAWGRPQADRPASLTVGTPLPGCPDRPGGGLRCRAAFAMVQSFLCKPTKKWLTSVGGLL